MMTGNTVKLATAASALKLTEVAFFTVLVMSYIVGFGTYRITDQVLRHSEDGNSAAGVVPRGPSPTPAIIAPVVFALFVLYDALCKLLPNHSRWFVPILSVGSAIVNAAGIESTGAVTCMMTGNLQKVGSHFADIFSNIFLRGPKITEEAHRAVRKPAMIVLSFTLGIFITNVAVRLSSALAESFPVVALLRRLPPFAVLG
eukprot:15361748-Ditylum_brightwellii.AAC.1